MELEHSPHGNTKAELPEAGKHDSWTFSAGQHKENTAGGGRNWNLIIFLGEHKGEPPEAGNPGNGMFPKGTERGTQRETTVGRDFIGFEHPLTETRRGNRRGQELSGNEIPSLVIHQRGTPGYCIFRV